MTRAPTVAAIAFGLFSASCDSSDQTSPPPIPPSPAQLVAWTPVRMIGELGDTVAQSPTVRITDSSGAPIPGSRVHFAIVAGNGLILHDAAATDANGLASVGWWSLGYDSYSDTLIATVVGLPPVTFAAQARSAAAIYDLQSVGGHAVPYTDPWGGTTIGGHYVLYDDGTCTTGADGSFPGVLAYVRADSSTILFYALSGTYFQSSFYIERNGLFATGRLSRDGTMTVTYEDTEDFVNPEVYARRSAAQGGR